MKVFIKDYFQTILITVVVGLLVWNIFFPNYHDEPNEPVQIVVPAVTGVTEKTILENVKTVPFYIPMQGEVIVDEKYKLMYEQSKDSIERLNLYMNAIKVNNYNKVFIDDENLTVSGDVKTRGELLEYKFDYNIKERYIQHEPKIIKERPRFSLSVEADAGIPTTPTTGFLMRGALGFENKRGEAITVGYDTENRVWVGLRKNIKIVN